MATIKKSWEKKDLEKTIRSLSFFVSFTLRDDENILYEERRVLDGNRIAGVEIIARSNDGRSSEVTIRDDDAKKALCLARLQTVVNMKEAWKNILKPILE